jgi:Domain of unknown function (DUF4307)
MSNPNELSPEMQARYGTSGHKPTPYLVSLLILVISAVLWGGWHYKQSHQIVSSRLDAFTVLDAHKVNITTEVSRPENTTTYCILRAQNANRVDVGYATVTVPAGQTTVAFTYPLNTESRAVVAEVLNCSATLPMRAPAPNFPPGVKIPSQPLPGVAPSAK